MPVQETRDTPGLGTRAKVLELVSPSRRLGVGYGGGVATAEDISYWRERGARTDAEARAAHEMVELMVTISEGAYQGAWCQDLPELLRPAVERLIAGQDPDFEIRNPDAPYADEVPDALRALAAIVREHRIWIRETDDLSDYKRVVPDAF